MFCFQFSACNCNSQGSTDVLCNDNGVCNCKTNVVGSKCIECADGYNNFPTCTGGKRQLTFLIAFLKIK